MDAFLSVRESADLSTIQNNFECRSVNIFSWCQVVAEEPHLSLVTYLLLQRLISAVALYYLVSFVLMNPNHIDYLGFADASTNGGGWFYNDNPRALFDPASAASRHFAYLRDNVWPHVAHDDSDDTITTYPSTGVSGDEGSINSADSHTIPRSLHYNGADHGGHVVTYYVDDAIVHPPLVHAAHRPRERLVWDGLPASVNDIADFVSRGHRFGDAFTYYRSNAHYSTCVDDLGFILHRWYFGASPYHLMGIGLFNFEPIVSRMSEYLGRGFVPG